MLKKIETFLVIMLAICAVLLLLAGGGQSRQTGEETAASAAQTEPSDAPPTTRPEAEPTDTETEPSDTVPVQTEPVSQARRQVERVLERAGLVQTAVTRRVESAGLGASEDTAGLYGESHAAALAELAEGWTMNPVAAFWELVSAGLYEKRTDETGKLDLAAMKVPEQTAKQYENTNEGARLLLTELLSLAARIEDTLALEQALLGTDQTLEGDQIFWSEAEKCRYAYFSCASDRGTYILCFYLRGGERIEDVELQLLHLRHASGGAESLAGMDQAAKKQAASLMAAAELLMTGKTRAGEGAIPFSYEVGGAKASLERFEFTGDPDRGSLVNYRLRMK